MAKDLAVAVVADYASFVRYPRLRLEACLQLSGSAITASERLEFFWSFGCVLGGDVCGNLVALRGRERGLQCRLHLKAWVALAAWSSMVMVG